MDHWQAQLRAARTRGGAAWTPAQPTTDGGVSPIAWYDASALTAGALATWEDLAGSYDLLQATADAQPSVVTGVANGLSVVRFASATRWMAMATRISTLRTVSVVTKWATPVADYSLIVGDLAYQDFHGESGGKWTSPAYSSYYVRIGGFRQNGQAADMFTTLKPTSAFAISTWTPADNCRFGATKDINQPGRHFVGDCPEIVVYSSVLSAPDLAQLDTYLATKYGITLS